MYRLLAILALFGTTLAQDNITDLDAVKNWIVAQNSTTAGTGQIGGTSGTVQNTDSSNKTIIGTGQNTGGISQNTDGMGENISGTSQNTNSTGQNIGGTSQNTNGTGQNKGGTSENIHAMDTAGGRGQNTTGTNQNTDVIVSVLGNTTTVPPFVESTNSTESGTSQNIDGTNQTSEASDVTTCMTEKGDLGECVLYYLCNVTIMEGDGIIDIHDPLKDPCPTYLEVCCPTRKIAVVEPITTPIREGCGYSNPNGVDTEGSGATDGEAKFGEFPWVVAILKDSVNETGHGGQKLPGYVGGGSLIHPSVVLTAAHNVAAGGPLRVRAGEWNTQTTDELYPHQERDVAKIIIHKDFNKGNLFYDIAVLFLSAQMELAPNVGVVCLPPPREKAQGGTKCFSSSWGKKNFGRQGLEKVTLNKVEVSVVGRQLCQESLRKTRLGNQFMLHSSFMCSEKDGCKADGGAPLVCPIEFEEDRYMQSGIAAWGVGCGQGGTPGVYVDVANLRAWIDDKVKGQGYLISGYSYTV